MSIIKILMKYSSNCSLHLELDLQSDKYTTQLNGWEQYVNSPEVRNVFGLKLKQLSSHSLSISYLRFGWDDVVDDEHMRSWIEHGMSAHFHLH